MIFAPAGAPLIRYVPSSPVKAPTLVPSMVTLRRHSEGFRLRSFVTFPVIACEPRTAGVDHEHESQ